MSVGQQQLFLFQRRFAQRQAAGKRFDLALHRLHRACEGVVDDLEVRKLVQREAAQHHAALCLGEFALVEAEALTAHPLKHNGG